jgi:uncharacterized phage-associated protein
MKYEFDEIKATQASAYLIKKYGGTLNYLKLMKMLYIANRQSLLECGSPIVPDSFVSMKYGPVLSNLYDKINLSSSKTESSFWNEHLKVSNYSITLVKDPDNGKLSRRSMRILDEIDKQWHEKPPFEIAQWTHDNKNIPEWSNPGDSSIPIAIEKILHTLGKNSAEIRYLTREEKQYQKEAEVFNALQHTEEDCLLC